MGFTELNFLLRFLPVFLVLYYTAPAKYRNFILFAGSLVFYGLGDWKAALWLLLLTILNYVLITRLQKEKSGIRYLLLGLLIGGNLAPLIVCKIVLGVFPLGMSFYTFMLLTAVIDVYRGQVTIVSFVRFATYVLMFPKLIQGPIVPYREMNYQLGRRTMSLQKIEAGLAYFIVGLSFKVLIADKMGIFWKDVQTIGYESISTPMAWCGILAYSMQLYFDFQGYSMMAIGLGQMLGFRLPANFDHPYRSHTVSEYYRRWHITLGAWFRDYVYIPLGGSRKGMPRTILNLIVVWILTGLWHGITWNFLLWAGVLVFFIVLEKLLWGKFLMRHRIISLLYIWLIIPLTWLIFAISDLNGLWIYFGRLFPFWGDAGIVNNSDFLVYGLDFVGIVVVAFLISLPLGDKLWEKWQEKWWMKLILLGLLWFCVFEIANGSQNPFLYSVF